MPYRCQTCGRYFEDREDVLKNRRSYCYICPHRDTCSCRYDPFKNLEYIPPVSDTTSTDDVTTYSTGGW